MTLYIHVQVPSEYYRITVYSKFRCVSLKVSVSVLLLLEYVAALIDDSQQLNVLANNAAPCCYTIVT